MKRLFLCDVLGTGEPDVDEFRPAVAEYPVGWSVVSNMDDDPTVLGWLLVEVSIGDMAPLYSDPRIDTLPNVSMDAAIGEIPVQEYQSMRDALVKRGIGVPEVGTFGEVVAYIKLRSNAANVNPTMGSAVL